jgi:hypothetical protein
MNTKPFDPTKPVRTSDGLPARVLCADLKGKATIVAAVTQYEAEIIQLHYPNGLFYGPDPSRDLINIPEKRRLTGWINVYPTNNTHQSKAMADGNAGDSRIACLDLSKYNIEFEEGEGL